jgi:hypothetical protein
MARDIVHQIVKETLINDGWTITHDPYLLGDYNPEWEIDFGAEKLIAAERDSEKIAVEAKSFLESSFAYEFHKILGQYLNYRMGLSHIETGRTLFLAVPEGIHNTEFQRQGIINSVSGYDMKILVYNPVTKTVLQWLP